MRRFRPLLHLVTALLLSLQLARGSVDLLLCLHEDQVHLTYAHPECCAGSCDAGEREENLPAFSHDDCNCLDIPLPGHNDSPPGPAPTRMVPAAPLLSLPADAVRADTGSDPPAPPPSPPDFRSHQPLLRRSVELRI